MTWIPLAEHPIGAAIARFTKRSFVARDPDGKGIRIRYEVRPLEDPSATSTHPAELRATVSFGAHAEGPPGHAHGGAMAAVLDEAMGLAVWLAHSPAVAAHLETDFRHPIPLGATMHAFADVGPVEGTGKAQVTSRIVDADGKVHAEGRALFVLLGDRHAGRFKGGGA